MGSESCSGRNSSRRNIRISNPCYLLAFIFLVVFAQSVSTEENVSDDYHADEAGESEYFYEYLEYEYEEPGYEYQDNYNGNYSHGEYAHYDGGEQESDQPVPVLTSSPSNHLVDLGNTARLSCTVDNLGSTIISWSRKDPETGNSKILAVAGNVLESGDMSRMTVSVTETSSTLTIALMKETDTGDYICEVSSIPPVLQAHRVEIRYQAQVKILDHEDGQGPVELTAGDKLQLQCQGKGDPEPQIFWSRENSLLPNGESKTEQKVLEYEFIDEKYAGVYTCTADNGFGQPSKQSVTVNVQHTPVIYVHENFIYNTQMKTYQEVTALELVCSVQAYPSATVTWSRQDKDIVWSKTRLEVDGGKHLLIIDNPTKYDVGLYSCAAKNTQGEVHAVLEVKDESNVLPEQEMTSDQILHDSPQPTRGERRNLAGTTTRSAAAEKKATNNNNKSESDNSNPSMASTFTVSTYFTALLVLSTYILL